MAIRVAMLLLYVPSAPADHCADSPSPCSPGLRRGALRKQSVSSTRRMIASGATYGMGSHTQDPLRVQPASALLDTVARGNRARSNFAKAIARLLPGLLPWLGCESSTLWHCVCYALQ